MEVSHEPYKMHDERHGFSAQYAERRFPDSGVPGESSTDRANDGETLYKRRHGKEANLSHLREIDCEAFVHKEQPQKDRGGQSSLTAEQGRLIGHSETSPSYRVLLDGPCMKVVTSRNVTFREKEAEVKSP